MARFAALRSLWLRQANLCTLLALPKMPAGLRRGARPRVADCTSAQGAQPVPASGALRFVMQRTLDGVKAFPWRERRPCATEAR